VTKMVQPVTIGDRRAGARCPGIAGLTLARRLQTLAEVSSALRRSAGFSLVELMIVIAIVGVLSAIALPAFSRYVKKSRTAEAVGQLNKMWSGSISYYEADHADTGGTILPKQFPGAGLTAPQEATCCGQPGDKCLASSTVYDDHIWEALSINARDTHSFRPVYASVGIHTSAAFVASTYGDLDCDSILSTFQRNGSVDPQTGDVNSATAVYVDREIE
jgi:prepilin-type N-terminal cleavage/methylation domain-containing protein